MISYQVKRILGSSSIYLISNFLNKAISVLMIPILTRYLLPAEYGQVLLFLTLMVFFNPALYCGSIDLIAIDYFKSKEEFNDTLEKCNSAVLYLNIAATALFILAAPLIMNFFAVPFLIIAILPVTCLLSYYLELLLLLLRYQARHTRYFFVSLVKTLIEAGVTILFLLGLHWGWYSRIVGVIAGFLIALIFLLQIIPFKKMAQRFDLRSFLQILKRGAPFIIAQFLIIAYASADKFLVTGAFNKDQLGIYGIAFQVAALLTVFSASVSAVLQPIQYQLATDINQQKREKIIKISVFFITIQLAAGCMLIIVSPFLYHYFIDAKYNSGMGWIKWLVIANFLAGCSTFFINIVRQKGRGRHLVAINLYPIILLIICFFILTPYFDIEGIIYSYIIVNLIILLVAARKAQQVISIDNTLIYSQLKKILNFYK